jgi:hypothetical protein
MVQKPLNLFLLFSQKEMVSILLILCLHGGNDSLELLILLSFKCLSSPQSGILLQLISRCDYFGPNNKNAFGYKVRKKKERLGGK